MDWHEARDRTVAAMVAVRDAIGEADELTLLTEINTVCGLCERAKEDWEGEGSKCRYCIFYDRFGGCQEVNAEMSECVVSKDWDGLRTLMDRFIADLRRLELPPPPQQ